MNDFNFFKCDTPFEKGFDEFCQRWWMKIEKKELSDSGWSNYVPNDEWKRLEVEKNDSNQANQECMGEYGPMIYENDFEYMCDYLLSKDAPFTINNDEGRLEETRAGILWTGSQPYSFYSFGDIPTVIPSTSMVALETSTIALIFRMPLHMLPAISPFICTDSSEAPDSSDGPPSQDPYVATVARWRSRVTARPSSSHEFPIAPVTAPARDSRRKRVGPLPSRKLASRHAPPRSPDHHSSSSSSSSDSSPVQFLGEHHYVVCISSWCLLPLSTLYPPTTSESSSRDSSEGPMHSSPHSARPSRKRCRSLVDSAPLSMPVTGSLAPTRADLSPLRKRFRDSYSSEASIEEDAEVGLTGTGVDLELGIGDGDGVGDHVGIDHKDARVDTEEYEADASTGDMAEVGIDPMTAPLVEEEIVEPAREDSPDTPGTGDDIVRSVEDTPVDLSDVVHDFYHHMSEIRVDRIVGIKTAQRRLEADQLIASGDRARMAEMIYNLRLENLKVRAMLDIERDRVSSLRLHMSLSQEEFRQIRRDHDDARGRLRRLESYLGRRFGFRP
ncbi:hypothetical protein Tco_1183608 [Tanacetum coccineum]